MQATATRGRPRGLGALVQVQNFRTLVQLAFAALIVYTVSVRTMVGEDGATIVASGEALCPFGGFEALYRFVSSGGKVLIPHTHLSNVVLFVGLIATTVLFRGAFCGWMCPFGAMQEWIYKLSAWVQRRIPGIGSAVKALKGRPGPRGAGRPSATRRLDHWLRYLKYGLLLWIIWGTIVYGRMVFRDIDPWAAMVNFTEEFAVGGLVVLIVVVAASFFVERAWCRYACPLGAIVGLVAMVSPVRIQREGSACTGCSLCDRKCPVGIPVSTVNSVTDPTCNMCLKCVEACPRESALDLTLVLPGVKA